MNIFATSPSARVSAFNLDDKRVVKMALETAQMLSSAIRLSLPEPLVSRHLYKTSHVNHPCSVWARGDLRNFMWLYDHGVALTDEYRHRFERRHASRDVMDLALEHVLEYGDCFPGSADDVVFDFNSSGFTVGNDVHQNYRLCMIRKWCSTDILSPRWTYRGRPAWYRTYLDLFNSLEGNVQ